MNQSAKMPQNRRCSLEEIVQFLFFFFFSLLCDRSLATFNSTYGVLHYAILEEKPIGTTVGNVASDAGLYQTLSSDALQRITFSISSGGSSSSSTPNATEYFSIDYGIMRVTKVINRDAICPQSPACEFLFSVMLQPKEYFQVIKVSVTVDDINDCAPVFSPSYMNITISESSPVGEILPFPSATDLDSPANGVANYVLQPDTDPFRLQVYNVSGVLDARLNLTSFLDREKQSFYSLTLVAYDSGTPPKSGSMTLEITVADVDDNSPVFDNATYEVHVPENTSVGSVLVEVHATDRDVGSNARIQYRFSQRSQDQFGGTFFLEPDSGKVVLLKALNAAEGSSYSLSIQAIGPGPNSLTGTGALRIFVQPVIDRPPLISVDTLNDDGLAKVPDSSPTGTFVAVVSVDVSGGGGGGQSVACSLNDTENFRLVQMIVNQFKIVTAKVLNVGVRNNYVVMIRCYIDGDPSLFSVNTLPVSVTSSTIRPPVFSNSTYSATITAYASPGSVLVRVDAVSTTPGRNLTVTYSLDDGRFSIESRSGVVTTLVSFGGNDVGTEIPLSVIAFYAELGRNLSSRTLVQVTVTKNAAKSPRFQQDFYSFGVPETTDVGTSIGSVVAVVPTGDSVLYQVVTPRDSASGLTDLNVDRNSGVISTSRALNRDAVPRYEFRITACNVGFTDLNDTATVNVIVHANRPDVTFSGPADGSSFSSNNTVYISSTAGTGTLVASVHTRLPFPGHALCLSLGNLTDLFSLNVQAGEIRLTSNVSAFSNQTLTLTIVASVCAFQNARSSAVLYVVIVGEVPGVVPQRSPASGAYESKVVVLACVLAVCLVLAVVMIVAIVIVCRRSRKRRRNSASAALFWNTIPIHTPTSFQRADVVERRSTTLATSGSGDRQPRPADVEIDLHPPAFKLTDTEDADADSGYPSNSNSSQTSSDDGGGGAAAAAAAGEGGGGGGGRRPASSATADAGSRDDFRRSFRTSGANNSGIGTEATVFATASSSQFYSSAFPNWLRSSTTSLGDRGISHRQSLKVASKSPEKPQLKPSLSRSGSQASRKSILLASDGSTISESKKRVTFAEEDQYLELSSADLTSSDVTDPNDVTDARSPGDDVSDDVSSDASSNADSDVRRTVINTLANTYANTPRYPPPGVAFGTFLPEDGSLV